MKELCLAHTYILFHHQQQPALRGYIALLVMAEPQRTTPTPTQASHQVSPKCRDAHAAVGSTKAACSDKDVRQFQQSTMSLVTDNVHLTACVAAANISQIEYAS